MAGNEMAAQVREKSRRWFRLIVSEASIHPAVCEGCECSQLHNDSETTPQRFGNNMMLPWPRTLSQA